MAVTLGTATNHSADAIAITHSHGESQELLYKAILDSSGVDPLTLTMLRCTVLAPKLAIAQRCDR
jgi:acyl transferase domain-containing protein